MKAYITKYCLRSGKIEQRVGESKDGMFVCKHDGHTEYYHGNDWHESLAAARSKAREMRVKKIASLGKQMERLAKLDF